MEQGLNDIVREGGGERTLRLQLPPTFAQTLAMPLLRGFRADFPEVLLDITTAGYTGPPRNDADVAVIYDRPSVGDQITDLLWMHHVAPACCPAVAKLAEGKSLREFLGSNELLHIKLEGRPRDLIWEGFARHHQLDLPTKTGLAFDTAIMAAQYAQAGSGVTLLDVEMFANDITAGRLVIPFDATYQDGYGYFMRFEPEDLNDPVVATFRGWMIHQFTRHRSVLGLVTAGTAATEAAP